MTQAVAIFYFFPTTWSTSERSSAIGGAASQVASPNDPARHLDPTTHFG